MGRWRPRPRSISIEATKSGGEQETHRIFLEVWRNAMDEIARREFVKGAALGAFVFTVGGIEVLLTPQQARAQGAAMRVLKPEEAQTLEAIGETLAIGARQ